LILITRYYLSNVEKKNIQKALHLKKIVENALAQVLEEGEVVNLGNFRKERRDKEHYYGEVLVSKDGAFTLDPEEFFFVKLTHRDQADAIVDGDVDAAEDLGAKVYDLSKLVLSDLEPDKIS